MRRSLALLVWALAFAPFVACDLNPQPHPPGVDSVTNNGGNGGATGGEPPSVSGPDASTAAPALTDASSGDGAPTASVFVADAEALDAGSDGAARADGESDASLEASDDVAVPDHIDMADPGDPVGD